MGFQYDSDDLGYEWGYDKSASQPDKEQLLSRNDHQSSVVSYKCDVADSCKNYGITSNSSLAEVQAALQKADAEAAKKEQAYKKEAGEADAANNPEDQESGKFKKESEEAKAALRQLQDAQKCAGDLKNLEKSKKEASAKKPEKEVAAPKAKPTEGSAEAAKQEALRDTKYKTLKGGQPADAAKDLVAFLNGKTTGKGWSTIAGSTVNGKQTFQVVHKTAGKIDQTIGFTGDKEAQSTEWKLGTKAPPSTAAEVTAETSKITAAKAAGEKALTGLTDKAKAKANLEKEGFKIEEKDVSEKDGTITIKASKDGKEYTFEVKGGKATTKHAPVVAAHHIEAKGEDEVPHSTEETQLDSALTREGASLPTVEKWKGEAFSPSQRKTEAQRKKEVVAAKGQFETYLKEVPKEKDPKRGQSFVQERRAAHQLEKIRQKLTSKDGAGATSADVREALEARGFVLKDLPGAAGYKIVGRTQMDGTVSLSDKDIADLASFNADVQAGKFDKKEELAVDTQRHLLVRAYLSQTKEEGQGILAGLGYIDEKGNPTAFNVNEFQHAMFSDFGGFTRPQPEQLKSYVDSFKSYQEKLKFNEQYRETELRGLAPDSNEARTINRRYDGAALQLRKDFQGEITKKLKSEKDPNVREYIQEQLQASGFNEADPKKFDQDKFAGSITSGYFVRSVNQYQSDLQRNEELRSGELAALGDHGPKGKHPDKKKIKEINDKFDGQAKELRTKFDQEMDKQLKEADPATRDYMKSKLEASGYYTKGQPDTNWKPAQVDELSKSIALPHVQSPGVAKRPNQALVDGLKKAEEKASKEALKHKNDPEKLREVADDLKKRADRLLEKADPVTQSRLKQVGTQFWLDKVHERLKAYGFSDGDARAIERSWGLIDRMDGKVSPKLEMNVAREKFEYLIGADNGGVPPARTAILRNALKSYRQDLPPALGGALGLSGETVAKGMQAKGYFGPTEKVKPGTLEKMARDLERVELAKEAKEKGDTNAFQSLSKEYSEAAKTTTMPSAGTPEGDQAVIAAAKADQASPQAGGSESPSAGGEKTEAKGADPSGVTAGGTGKGKKSRYDLDREQRAKEHADNQSDTKSRIGIERGNLNLREREFEFNKGEARLKRAQEAEKMEFERERLEVEKEKTAADRVFQDKQQKKQLEAQMLQTLIQATTSFLASIIQAAMGMLGQVFAAGHQVLAATIQVQQPGRR